MFELVTVFLILCGCRLFFSSDVKSITTSQLELKKQTKKKKSVLSLDPYQTPAHPVQNRKNRKGS